MGVACFYVNGYKVYDGKCGANCFDGVYEKNRIIYINEVKPMNENGSIKLNSENSGTKLAVQMSGLSVLTQRKIYDYAVTTTAIPVAAPFAAAQGLPPSVWNALSLLLGAVAK